MKNLQAPRTLSECEFRTGYPFVISTRRARVFETVAGWIVIVSLVLFTAWAITGA